MQNWAREDYAAAGNWLNEQSAGITKNAAIKTYADALHSREPEAAADWAVTLPEGKERSDLLQTIHSSLKEIKTC